VLNSFNSNFELRPAASRRFAVTDGEIAAAQRGWRDFRIAQCSCERGIPAAKKLDDRTSLRFAPM
jgi:hypothetical protein